MAIQRLLSLPPRMAREFDRLCPQHSRHWWATADPRHSWLGSGGGTAYLLTSAWRATAARTRFADWLRDSRKLLVHAGGKSSRLPAYAPVGKVLIPIPVLRWQLGQRLDQTLLDLQQPVYEQLLAAAPARTVVMVASGDVLLRCGGRLPAFPDVDVLIVGMWVKPEEASHHGVLFCSREQPEQLAFFLQKPSPDQIRELSARHLFLIDTGVWLLSERAVNVLLAKCGWNPRRQDFAGGVPATYELYAELGLALGTRPARRDSAVNTLTSGVVPLPDGEFYHFGTNRTLIESVSALQNRVLDQTQFGLTTGKPQAGQHTQNSVIHAPIGPANHTLWIENAHLGPRWQLAHDHVLTGIPVNDWRVRLPAGACLDFVPLDARRYCIRYYRIDDSFAGAAQHERRFPVRQLSEIDGAFLESLFQQPVTGELSAHDLMEQTDLRRLFAAQRTRRETILLSIARNHRRSVFFNLDLQATAQLFRDVPAGLPSVEPSQPIRQMQERMFRAAVLRHLGRPGAVGLEREAFARLREVILREMELQPVAPMRHLLDDQIVWGRSPVRLDIAGGWTDTPPYCLQHGGRVVNVAVNLNGQPPIQVFARVCNQPEVVVRSIDLGIEERIRTYEQLGQYNQVGSGFTIAKAALALAGFLPRFHAGRSARTLRAQLERFGGGIEISLLCAVPKGSGLGTSSVLAATLLGTLSEMCGLGWDRFALNRRTLALEQMLTTGGGWQDQVGALWPGVKFIQTEAGLAQTPVVHWLPPQLFADETVLLYYTGLTRVAKEILAQIVRRIFLNDRDHLVTLAHISDNAEVAADAIMRNDAAGLAAAVRASWQFNQQLDPSTNPPQVQAILERVEPHLAGAKLLGAGGGGYLLMIARDTEAARQVRRLLTERPPNPRARFVAISVSDTGFQVTRS